MKLVDAKTLINDPGIPMMTPREIRDLSNMIDAAVAMRGLLQAEQSAAGADRQRMIEAVEETRGTINKLLDGLVELLKGSMDERIASVEKVIGGPG